MDAEISTFYKKEIGAQRESVQHFSFLAFIHKVWGSLSRKIEGLAITSQLDLVLALSGQLVEFAQAQAQCLKTDVAVSM